MQIQRNVEDKFQSTKNIPKLKMATTDVQFVNFPAEIILKVFGYLEKEDIFKCSLISRRLRTICQPNIWENIHLYNPNPICEYFMNTCTNDDQNSHKMPGCLNINSKKVHGQSLQYILDKGCNYYLFVYLFVCLIIVYLFVCLFIL